MDAVVGIVEHVWSTGMAMAPFLLIGLLFAGALHVLVQKSFISRHLGSDSACSVVKAALLGVPLPLCSCGVIPTALSLRKSNASPGAVMSFLVSTPQTGVDSIIATYGMLGPVFAVFRPVAALCMGIVSGLVLRLGMPRQKQATPLQTAVTECAECSNTTVRRHGPLEKIQAMLRYAFGPFLDDITLPLLFGIVLSGVLSYLLPEDFFQRYVANDFVGMALMVLVGIPLYVCATSSIPIAMTLMMKGLSPGAAFVFLAVGPVTNAASMLVIGKTMGRRFLVSYIVTTVLGALAAGMLLNGLFALAGDSTALGAMAHHHHHQGATQLWQVVAAYVFLAVLLLSLSRKLLPGAWPVLRRRHGAAAVITETDENSLP